MILVVMNAAAREEMFDASEEIDSETPGRGEAFLAEVDRVVDRIAEYP